ncbi:uncharacterized protein F4822DRAFT_424003 [Hypoxylon trugodes]|uniref:uncharacterized protein n=1 Tax=Hypoxylon trugodes TaxID=326681 RepID=UPI002192B975|nr:uncharacterized protein F4822DRAFT_424003 [Hypoxylon trugodes]KAI1393534.1 hypothetical protein F4822DRAFT_424003 [Hypoxylon trugodes]
MSTSHFPTKARIREIFAYLTAGDAPAFYAHVADDVDWTVMGTHALSGHYKDKEMFLSQSLSRISAVFDGVMKLHVKSVIGGEIEEWAVIELAAEAKCKNVMLYNNTYSWSTRWKDGKIVEVRACLDGLLLNRALAENEKKS